MIMSDFYKILYQPKREIHELLFYTGRYQAEAMPLFILIIYIFIAAKMSLWSQSYSEKKETETYN